MLDLKKFIGNTSPESNAGISNLVLETDNGKVSYTVIKTNDCLHDLKLDIIDNGNKTSNELNKVRLLLTSRGLGKLAVNFIKRIKKFAMAWWIIGSFHKGSSFDSHISFSPFLNLDKIEKSHEPDINKQNEIHSKETRKNVALKWDTKKNSNCITTDYLNISSIQNTYEMLTDVISNTIDLLLISEAKLDDTFPLSEFISKGFTPPYRLDRKRAWWRPNCFRYIWYTFLIVT